ncbi:2,3-diaminopropionate biosynthesis protein SbnA [Sorangium sp. So ce124]|uniref:2,3-diaminopropionate biosynthesis protein SbnA n=1 Tax=Sorangium sp. So ce124 TaxID=3133280 RepID=UPI003F637582
MIVNSETAPSSQSPDTDPEGLAVLQPGAAQLASAGAPGSLTKRVEQLARAMRETPLVRIERPGLKLFAKLEYQNLVGSVKDRSALWILKSAIARGEIDQGTTVVESSSGNFAVAAAVYCWMLGLSFVPVIDPGISRINEAVLRSACESVIKVHVPDETGGFLRTRLAKVRELCASSPRTFWTNQYSNIDGMLGHYHLTGAEICEALPHVDYVFVSVSSGGTIAGVSRRVKERFPGVKVIAVDAEGSIIFGGRPKKRVIPGIGASVVPDLLRQALIDDVVIVREVDTIAACRELLVRHRLFLGGSSGTTYHAVNQYFSGPRSGTYEPSVVMLCADRGAAYIDTIYDDAWCAQIAEAS